MSKESKKIVISEELLTRIKAASKNGSIVATDVLKELKKNDTKEVFRGQTNNFASKVYTQSGTLDGTCFKKMRVVISCVNSDLDNPNCPDVNDPTKAFRSNNRTELSPAKFIAAFKHIGPYEDFDIAYFTSAICCSTPVKIKLENTIDAIKFAYDYTNYSANCQMGDLLLHNSCMRHSDTAERLADFYKNFAGAKILVAYDVAGAVMGRAIVWSDVTLRVDNCEGRAYKTDKPVSFLDRLYYTFDFVRFMMIEEARKKGVTMRKLSNDWRDSLNFVLLNDLTLLSPSCAERADYLFKDQTICVGAEIRLKKFSWHKCGAPWLDTFKYLRLTDDGKRLRLTNTEFYSEDLAFLQSTDMMPERRAYICPICGKFTNNRSHICAECTNKYEQRTDYGMFLAIPLRQYKKKMVPSICLTKNGTPTEAFSRHLMVENLFKEKP